MQMRVRAVIDMPCSEIDKAVVAAVLTTEHSASSHGYPVLVDGQGNVWGAADVACIWMPAEDYVGELAMAARRAGYKIAAEGR